MKTLAKGIGAVALALAIACCFLAGCGSEDSVVDDGYNDDGSVTPSDEQEKDKEEEECVHEWEFVSTTATCTNGGTETYMCSKCGDTKTERVDALGHDYVLNGDVVAATCTTAGYYNEKCTRCGSTRQVKTDDALGHEYEEIVLGTDGTEPGENDSLTMKYHCKNGCEDTYYIRDFGDSAVSTDTLEYGSSQYCTFYVSVDATGIYKAALEVDVNGDGTTDGRKTAAMENAALTGVYSINYLQDETENSSTYLDKYNPNIYFVYLQSGENTINFYLNIGIEIKSIRLEFSSAVDEVVSFSDQTNMTVNSQNSYSIIRLCRNSNSSSYDDYSVTKTATVENSGYYDLSYFCQVQSNAQMWVNISDGYSDINLFSQSLAGDKSDYTAAGSICSVGDSMLYYTNLNVYKGSSLTDDTDGSHTHNILSAYGTKGTHEVYLESGKTYTFTVGAASTSHTTSDRLYFGGGLFLHYAGDAPTSEHSHSIDALEVDSTCTAVGYKEDVCLLCGYTANGEEISMKSHSYVDVDGKAATCLEDGYSAGSRCEVCGAWQTEQQTIPATGHNYVESTLTETTQHKCSGCGDAYYTIDYEQGTKTTTAVGSFGNDTVSFSVTVGETGVYCVYLDTYSFSCSQNGGQSAAFQGSALPGVKCINYFEPSDSKFMNEYELTCYTVYLTGGANTLKMECNASFDIKSMLLVMEMETDAVSSVFTAEDVATVLNADGTTGTVTLTQDTNNSTATGSNTRVCNQTSYTTLMAMYSRSSGTSNARTYSSTLSVERSGYYDIASLFYTNKTELEGYVQIMGEGVEYTLMTYDISNAKGTSSGEYRTKEYPWAISSSGITMLLTHSLYLYDNFGYTTETSGNGVTYYRLNSDAARTDTHYVYLEAGVEYKVRFGGVSEADLSSTTEERKIALGGAIFAKFVGETI